MWLSLIGLGLCQELEGDGVTEITVSALSLTGADEIGQYVARPTTVTARGLMVGSNPDRVSEAGLELVSGVYEPILMMASISPHFFLVKRAGFSLDVTPRVDIRMVYDPDNSHPVPPPSYRPGGQAYIRLMRVGHSQSFLSVGFQHHSNGRQRPELDSNAVDKPNGSGTAEGLVNWTDDGRIDRDNSNFGYNYLPLGLYFASGDLTGSPRALSPNRIFPVAGIIFDWIPWWLGTEPGLWESYGLWRPGLTATTIGSGLFGVESLEFKITTTTQVILGKLKTRPLIDGELVDMGDFSRRLVFEQTYFLRFQGTDVAVFGQAYLGQDTYNYWFDSQIALFSFGIALDGTPRLGG